MYCIILYHCILLCFINVFFYVLSFYCIMLYYCIVLCYVNACYHCIVLHSHWQEVASDIGWIHGSTGTAGSVVDVCSVQEQLLQLQSPWFSSPGWRGGLGCEAWGAKVCGRKRGFQKSLGSMKNRHLHVLPCINICKSAYIQIQTNKPHRSWEVTRTKYYAAWMSG